MPRALDNVAGCWPEHRLLVVRLPGDEGTACLRLEPGEVEVGVEVDDPDEFSPQQTTRVRGLKVDWRKIGVKVMLRARTWSIGARQPDA